MKGIAALMKNAQKFRQRMEEMRKDLAVKEVHAESGGGMVRVTVDGEGRVKAVSIAPELVNPKEVTVLEDLIVAACRAARDQAAQEAADAMGQAANDLPMPPGMPPF